MSDEKREEEQFCLIQNAHFYSINKQELLQFNYQIVTWSHGRAHSYSVANFGDNKKLNHFKFIYMQWNPLINTAVQKAFQLEVMKVKSVTWPRFYPTLISERVTSKTD